jgi:hypothetical protein
MPDESGWTCGVVKSIAPLVSTAGKLRQHALEGRWSDVSSETRLCLFEKRYAHACANSALQRPSSLPFLLLSTNETRESAALSGNDMHSYDVRGVRGHVRRQASRKINENIVALAALPRLLQC